MSNLIDQKSLERRVSKLEHEVQLLKRGTKRSLLRSIFSYGVTAAVIAIIIITSLTAIDTQVATSFKEVVDEIEIDR